MHAYSKVFISILKKKSNSDIVSRTFVIRANALSRTGWEHLYYGVK